MRILTRYILREVVTYALLGGVLFTFVLFMRYLLTLMELAIRGSASLGDVARVTAFLLPNLLTLTIPMAALIGILLGLSRLASDSEITAMRASGMGVRSFLGIVSIFVSLAWIVGLANTLYLAPRAAAALLQFEEQRKTAQASFEVQPRVFYEDFKNYVLFVQDVRPSQGESVWRHVFLADLTQMSTPHIVTADEATVISDGSQLLHLRMANGSRHDVSPANPNQYNISTFASSDLPIQTGQQEDAHVTRRDTPMQALSVPALWSLAHQAGKGRPYYIELNRRISFPTACFVLMLVGVPLGLSSKRGGKSTGFILTLFLVFLYYFISSVGIALATQGKVSPFFGVWGANLGFGAAGLLLVQQMSRGGVALSLIATLGQKLSTLLRRAKRRSSSTAFDGPVANGFVQRVRRILHSRFPLIIDEYVMRSFRGQLPAHRWLYHVFTLFLVFTFFELIGDIVRYPHATCDCRRIPAQPDSVHLLQRRSAVLSDRRADHVRRAQPQQ